MKEDSDEAGDIEPPNIIVSSWPVEVASPAPAILFFPTPSEGINSALPEETGMSLPDSSCKRC